MKGAVESPEVESPEIETPVAQGEEGVGETEVGEGIEPPPEELEEQGAEGVDQSKCSFCFSFCSGFPLSLFCWRIWGGGRRGSPGLTRM